MYFFNNSIVLIKRYSLKKFNYLFVLTILGAVVESLGVGLMLPVVTAIIDPPTLKDLYFVGSLFEINCFNLRSADRTRFPNNAKAMYLH